MSNLFKNKSGEALPYSGRYFKIKKALEIISKACGMDGTRTRDLLRDRQAF